MSNGVTSCGKNVFNPWSRQGKHSGLLGGKLNQLFSTHGSAWKTTAFPRFTARFVHRIIHMGFGDITDYIGGFPRFAQSL